MLPAFYINRQSKVHICRKGKKKKPTTTTETGAVVNAVNGEDNMKAGNHLNIQKLVF